MCIKGPFSPFHLRFEPPSHLSVSPVVNRILRMTADDPGSCVIPDLLNMARTFEYNKISLVIMLLILYKGK